MEDGEREALRKFIQKKVLRVFKHPREVAPNVVKKYQYGVLIRYGQRSLINIEQTELCPPYDRTLPSETIYPTRAAYYDNYIYVPFWRQRSKDHAEEILLKKMSDPLLPKSKHMILYTYYSPCDRCTPQIIEKAGDMMAKSVKAKFTVVYSVPRDSKRRNDSRVFIQTLKDAGIWVERVDSKTSVMRTPSVVRSRSRRSTGHIDTRRKLSRKIRLIKKLKIGIAARNPPYFRSYKLPHLNRARVSRLGFNHKTRYLASRVRPGQLRANQN